MIRVHVSGVGRICHENNCHDSNQPAPSGRPQLGADVTVPVVAAALLFWACVFMIYFTSAGTTPLEFWRYAIAWCTPDSATWRAWPHDRFLAELV